MSESSVKIEELVNSYWERRVEDSGSDCEKHQQDRDLLDISNQLLELLSINRSNIYEQWDLDQQQQLLLDLRQVLEDHGKKDPYRHVDNNHPASLVRGLSIYAIQLGFSVCFGDLAKEFVSPFKAFIEALLEGEQVRQAQNVTVVALDCLVEWHETPEECLDRYTLALLSSKDFEVIKPYLQFLDPSIEKRWEYEARCYSLESLKARHPGIREQHEFRRGGYGLGLHRSGLGAGTRTKIFFPSKGYVIELLSTEISKTASETHFAISSKLANQEFCYVRKSLRAIRWLSDHDLWVAFDCDWAVFIDLKQKRFKPDPRCFLACSIEELPLRKLNAWIPRAERVLNTA